MSTPLNIILTWFQTGDIPTEIQFQATFSSFWHKDDLIPKEKISGLNAAFQNTVSAQAFQNHLNDENAHINLAKRDASNIIIDEFKKKLTKTFEQATESDTWMINHNLKTFPNFLFLDENGEKIEPDSIVYNDEDNATAVFIPATKGKAIY